MGVHCGVVEVVDFKADVGSNPARVCTVSRARKLTRYLTERRLFNSNAWKIARTSTRVFSSTRKKLESHRLFICKPLYLFIYLFDLYQIIILMETGTHCLNKLTVVKQNGFYTVKFAFPCLYTSKHRFLLKY
jgi:hypothetical protein